MKLNDRLNIIDWMTNVWTTPTLDCHENFGVALAQLCKQYLLCHGCDPKNVFDVLKEMDVIYNVLRKNIAKNGHPDNQEKE